MPLSIEEITEREEALRQEITEREHLLGAYQLIRADRAKPVAAKSTAALAPGPTIHRLEDRADLSPAPVTQPALVAPKINPELAAIGSSSYGKIVSWAIQQMTDDYTVGDIAALLKRQGCRMQSAHISVVLTRLKRRGEIEEISAGRGRRSAIFRKPETASPSTGDIKSTTESATRDW